MLVNAFSFVRPISCNGALKEPGGQTVNTQVHKAALGAKSLKLFHHIYLSIQVLTLTHSVKSLRTLIASRRNTSGVHQFVAGA